MKKYSFFNLIIILLLTTLMTSCSRKVGCYYSIDYPVKPNSTYVTHLACETENYTKISITDTEP